MRSERVVIVGGGMGGLAAASILAAHGIEVHLLEAMEQVGGKIRQVASGPRLIDAGPTVFTMRWVFEDLFEEAGASFADRVRATPLDILARHAWDAHAHLDLFADIDRSAAAIADFAGAAEARGYLRFCDRAGRVFAHLKDTFICQPEPRLDKLAFAFAFRPSALWDISPYASLWSSLGTFFRDPRLRQLFGRYATYCGSSPFAAPATLMLVSHVEQAGVWSLEGGMSALAQAVRDLAREKGATIRTGMRVEEILVRHGRAGGVRLEGGEEIDAVAVICNADIAALAGGVLGRDAFHAGTGPARSERSLSALTWVLTARAGGFPLSRHNVFFSADYAQEFDDLFTHRRLPRDPTIYICAQTRSGSLDEQRPAGAANQPDSLLCLVNAPARGEQADIAAEEFERCRMRAEERLGAMGLTLTPTSDWTMSGSPEIFNRLFPGTGGALYGPATHGWSESFSRAGSRSRVPGLYLAGGSVHPGPGVPMAALSGRMAARELMADLTLRSRSRRGAMRGGISTH